MGIYPIHTEIMARFPSIQVMYLFGSHASGNPRADSDVDIAVFTEGRETPQSIWNWEFSCNSGFSDLWMW
jgi:predicted nucleotidyltransferase